VLAPVEVEPDHLAQRLGRRTLVPAGHHLGLELGLFLLRLLPAALDLAADLPLAPGHQVNARVDDDLPTVAACSDHRLPHLRSTRISAISLTESLTEGKRKTL